jgi:HSP20 family protein
MDRLFEDSYVRRPSGWEEGAAERRYQLPVDVYTTPDEIVVRASLPGVPSDRVEINLEGDTLTIRGEIQAPDDDVDYVIQERGYGVLARTLTLNVPVNADGAEATFDNGVLTLTLPKAEELKPKKIEVRAK